ncbi:aminoacyl--tRNA ligase-related protein [Cohnella laeviribosi]|uniref:aminoacyl--tRNA ligase-related protein n=1 Tax=Cohnella laeviribosi TaxID=380174 RepID=UPI00036602A8|nr:aminoacyl--tRNA ligase-related protein [Cohnella laeviribosi]
MEIRYSVRDFLDDHQAQVVVSKLIYSSEGIVRCLYDSAEGEIVAFLADESFRSEVTEVIARISREEKQSLNIRHRIVKERNEHAISFHEPAASDFSPAVRKDEVVILYGVLDALFVHLARKNKARLREYRSMISFDALDKCRYISYFPQHIYMVSEFPHQMPVLEQVKEVRKAGYGDLSRLSGYALSPAVCFHCYMEWCGTAIDGPVVLTARGNCFRHEAPWRLGSHRLNEFCMREIVFAGDPHFVENLRNQILEDVWAIFNDLGLPGLVQTANDPFYYQEDKVKGQHQIIANMKYELIFQNDQTGESFAIASFNNVKDTLTRQFEIRGSDQTVVHSGCVAFGIDRWAYALLSAYGSDIKTWPLHIKKALKLNLEDEERIWAT